MNLYRYAEENGMSIAEIARTIDITPGYLYRILRGKTKATKKVIRALSKMSKGKITEEMLSPAEGVCKCCGRPYI